MDVDYVTPPGIVDHDLSPWQPGQGGPYQWDNLPNAPPPANEAEEPAGGGPPSMEGFHAIQGYENVGSFDQAAALPPPPPTGPPTGEPPKMEFDDATNLSEDQCREAMLKYVSKHRCYGKGCAKNMTMTEVLPTTAVHYILETFCEGRSTGYTHEPYRGGPVDGPECGMPPPPWAMPCNADTLFNDQVKKLEVPHTSTVKVCHRCEGRGFNRCYCCAGCGKVRCDRCIGDGRIMHHHHERGSSQEYCHSCGGDGYRRCSTCGGDGRVTCKVCAGFRQLRCYIQLTVRFVNHKSDFIMEKTDMPDELVRNVQGINVFQQVLPQVWPITCYPVKDINDNSVALCEAHRTGFPSERQLQQRHTLRAVPVTEVAYTWKDLKTRFWVYGHERKVYAPDYPQTCCWGCNIL